MSSADDTHREAIANSAVATGRGDDGTTGMLYGGRISKDDARTEAYGTTDEAVAALGVARAEVATMQARGNLPASISDLDDTLLQMQRDLFVAGAELAANPDATDRLVDGETRVDEAMLDRLETWLASAEADMEMPREFVVPGSSRLSAALEVARTIVRRAERRVITLDRDGLVAGRWLVPYINRLADLLWVYARVVEQAQGVVTTTSRDSQPQATAPRQRRLSGP
jgi:cob(I)alamin adenosyltransferase